MDVFRSQSPLHLLRQGTGMASLASRIAQESLDSDFQAPGLQKAPIGAQLLWEPQPCVDPLYRVSYTGFSPHGCRGSHRHSSPHPFV